MIGVYGGTFNPVHYGHLRTALEVKQAFALNEIRLIPCHIPPHRPEPEVSPEHRLHMLRLAVSSVPTMTVDRRELDRPGPSYMVETLKTIRLENPQQPLYLVIGTDAYKGLKSWHQWQSLFDYAHVVVVTRPGYRHPHLSAFLEERLVEQPDQLEQVPVGLLYFQAVTQLEISSTAIRHLIKQGHDPKFLLPDAVLNYIYQQKLYIE